MRSLINVTSALLASALIFLAVAEEAPPPATTTPIKAPAPIRQDRLNGAAKTIDLVGLPVTNSQGETLGRLGELVMDVPSGRIVLAVLTTAARSGKEDSMTAVPPTALHHDVANKVIHLDTTKEKLMAGPKFEMAHWEACCSAEYVDTVFSHYGRQGELTYLEDEKAVNSIPHSRLTSLQPSTALRSAHVKNRQDEEIGQVETLILDLGSGRILAVILDSGKYLDMPGHFSAVPPTALHYDAEGKGLQLDLTKSGLLAAPHFDAKTWPDLGNPVYAAGMYRAYKLPPYFTRSTNADVDNSGINVRDQGDQTLRPTDQGTAQSDLDLTAEIRKAVVDHKDLSFTAKNIKIMTNQGRVTLRGPVNNAEESHLICEIADGLARPENVDNQLEVKVTSSVP